MRLTFDNPPHAASAFLDAQAEPALDIRFEETSTAEAVEAFVIVGALFRGRKMEEAAEFDTGFANLLISEGAVGDRLAEGVGFVFGEILRAEEVIEASRDNREGMKIRTGKV